MSWDSEMPLILRVIIGDLADPPKYDDDRLSQLLLVAAQFVQQEVLLQNDYDISVENITIKPDPTLPSDRDDSFINLSILKAACLLVSSGLVKGAAQSVSVQSGNDRIDLTKNLEGSKILVQNFCQSYSDARDEYVLLQYTSGVNGPVGSAIIGPYRTLASRWAGNFRNYRPIGGFL